MESPYRIKYSYTRKLRSKLGTRDSNAPVSAGIPVMFGTG